MSDEMDVADVLDAAADLIRMHGLWKPGRPDNGPYCVITALNDAGDGLVSYEGQAAFEATHSIRSGMSAMDWNDAPRRTAKQVITALMEAAARVRTGEVKP